jgi:hypothetical protein
VRKCGLDSIGSVYGLMAAFVEIGNEFPGFIKAGNMFIGRIVCKYITFVVQYLEVPQPLKYASGLKQHRTDNTDVCLSLCNCL